MRFKSALSILMALPAATFAATPTTYSFTGKVAIAHVTSNKIHVGQEVPILVTLDTAFKANGTPRFPSREALFQGGACEYPNTSSPILAMTVAGQDAHGCYDAVEIDRNVNGVSRITISSYSPQAGAGLTIVLKAIVPAVVRNLNIPKTIDASQFKARRFSTSENFDYMFSGYLTK